MPSANPATIPDASRALPIAIVHNAYLCANRPRPNGLVKGKWGNNSHATCVEMTRDQTVIVANQRKYPMASILLIKTCLVWTSRVNAYADFNLTRSSL